MKLLKIVNMHTKRRNCIKISPYEKEKIQELADKYAAGNLSGWMRYAAMNYHPPAEDLDEVADEIKSDK